jgi:hypothetical protein
MNNLQYIESAKKEFEYYKLYAEKTFGQLTDDQLFNQFNNVQSQPQMCLRSTEPPLLPNPC